MCRHFVSFSFSIFFLSISAILISFFFSFLLFSFVFFYSIAFLPFSSILVDPIMIWVQFFYTEGIWNLTVSSFFEISLPVFLSNWQKYYQHVVEKKERKKSCCCRMSFFGKWEGREGEGANMFVALYTIFFLLSSSYR